VDDELRFVEALEGEIERLRRRAARSVLEPSKGDPIVFSAKESNLFRRAAKVLGHDSAEEFIWEIILSEAKRATVGCNSPEEA